MPRRKKKDEGAALSVDLGNSTTSVAALNPDGTVICLEDQDGLKETPSLVGFPGGVLDKALFGRSAAGLMAVEPQHTVDFSKASRGDRDAIAAMLGDGQAVTTAYTEQGLLQWRTDFAGRVLAKDITSLVMTVPANYDDAQRKATKAIVEAIGLKVLALVNEPTAALLSLQDLPDGTYVVADIGGGTFDVSVIRLTNGNEYAVLGTFGRDELGGKHFTANVVAYYQEMLRARGVGLDPTTHLRELTFLRAEVERAKCDISSAEAAYVSLRVGDQTLDDQLTRDTFEQLNQSLLNDIAAIATEALAKAGLSPDAVDACVLVGGASRMPCFQRVMAEIFGEAKIRLTSSPGTAVVEGAARIIRAKVKESMETGNADLVEGLGPEYFLVPEVEISEIVGHDIGVRALDRSTGQFLLATLIPAGTSIPHSATKKFGLECQVEGARFSTEIIILEGEGGKSAEKARELKRFSLSDLPPGQANERVAISLDIDANAMIDVVATDGVSNTQITGKVDASSVLKK